MFNLVHQDVKLYNDVYYEDRLDELEAPLTFQQIKILGQEQIFFSRQQIVSLALGHLKLGIWKDLI